MNWKLIMVFKPNADAFTLIVAHSVEYPFLLMGYMRSDRSPASSHCEMEPFADSLINSRRASCRFKPLDHFKGLPSRAGPCR